MIIIKWIRRELLHQTLQLTHRNNNNLLESNRFARLRLMYLSS